MSEPRYVVNPKADEDLDGQADYYAFEGSPELGHRFLFEAHETFALLATQPDMGWKPKLRHRDLKDLRLFRVSGSFDKVLILYRTHESGVEILRVLHGAQNLQRMLRREGFE